MSRNNIRQSFAKEMSSCRWNKGPTYLLSNACTPEPKKTQSHASKLSYTLCPFYCVLWASVNESCITFGKSEIIEEATNHPQPPRMSATFLNLLMWFSYKSVPNVSYLCILSLYQSTTGRPWVDWSINWWVSCYWCFVLWTGRSSLPIMILYYYVK